MAVSIRRERVLSGDDQLRHLAMAASDGGILPAELLKEGFPFFLTPVLHQAYEPFRLLALERHLSFPLRLEQIFVFPGRFVSRHYAGVVSGHDHCQPAGDPKTLGLQEALVVLLHRWRIKGLQSPFAPR